MDIGLMRMVALLLIIFLSSASYAQPSKGWVIKTRPITLAVTNLNLEGERVLSDKFSLSGEIVWRRYSWKSHGGEFNFGGLSPSRGMALTLSPRYYLRPLKQKAAPYGYYIAGIIRYYSFRFDNFTLLSSTSGVPTRVVNIHSSGPELGFLIGTQFRMWKLISDLNCGLGIYNMKYKETFISGNHNYLFDANGERVRRNVEPYPYLRWSVGYYFGKKSESGE